MRRLIALLVIAFAFAPTVSADIPAALMLGQSVPAPVAVGGGYLVDEQCEGAGTPSGWTNTPGTGSINWDETSGALLGSQSLRINVSSVYPTTASVSKTFTGTDPVDAFFIVNSTYGTSDDATMLGLYTSGAGTLLELGKEHTSHFFYVWDGSSAHNSSVVMTSGTKYYVWVHYLHSGTTQVFISTTTTKPGSPDITYTNPNSGTAALLALGAGFGDNNLFDHILVSASTIGSNP